MLKTRLSESPMAMLHQTSWLLHWCAVFSFAAEKSNGLFAALLTDRANYGDAYLNIIQLAYPNLMRQMVAAFLLGRSHQYQPQPMTQASRTQITALEKDSLQTIGLPIIIAEQDAYSDSFTKFTIALLEDYDFEQALEFARLMQTDA